jgi:hypothetical protein
VTTAATTRGNKAAPKKADSAQLAIDAEVFKPKLGKIDLAKLEWHVEPNTGAEWATWKGPVGDWLGSMGVWDDAQHRFDATRVPTTAVQRTILAIGGTSKKGEMLFDVLQGGTVPPPIMMVSDDGTLTPLDGLQRMDVFTQTAQGLMIKEYFEDGIVPLAVQAQLEKIHLAGLKPIKLAEHLAAIITVIFWRKLTEAVIDSKFKKLNLGQNQVSPRHMTEVFISDIGDKLNKMGIATYSEKMSKTVVFDSEGKPVKNPYKGVRQLAKVAVGVYAYSSGMLAAVKDSLQNDRAAKTVAEKLSAKTTAEDLKAVYLRLMPALQAVYSETDTTIGGQIKGESDTFMAPMLAALGSARAAGVPAKRITEWFDSMIEELKTGGEDPLNLFTGDSSWDTLCNDKRLKGSVGVRQRRLTYAGWLLAIKDGMPFNWEAALLHVVNNQV